MLDNLTNENLLDDIYSDLQIFRLKYHMYQRQHELWLKWLWAK